MYKEESSLFLWLSWEGLTIWVLNFMNLFFAPEHLNINIGSSWLDVLTYFL